MSGPARSADFQSAVSPISNRQGEDESEARRSFHGPQAGSPAIQQIGNLRYDGEPDATPLTFLLAVRGTLRPRVSADAQGVLFQDASGATVLDYTGLKVLDDDGKVLASHFAPAEGGVRLLVEERGARYPLTIDPIALQAYLKPDVLDSSQAGDNFGISVAVSGDTVVVGAYWEDSSTTGLNSMPNESAKDSGAAYNFTGLGPVFAITSIIRSGANVLISFPSDSGKSYTLWRSDTPAPVPGVPNRFYRVLSVTAP